MRRRVLLLALLAVVAAGCGEDAVQRDAREALQASLRGSTHDPYDVEDAHCTRGGRVYFQPVRTTRFVCTVRRVGSGDCDWFRVDLRETGPAAVTLLRRRASCVLPA